MKVWEEDEVLRELVADRLVVESSGHTNHAKSPFLLILVHKVQRKCYEFIYYPSETFERIDDVFQSTCVEMEDGALNSRASCGPRVMPVQPVLRKKARTKPGAQQPFEPYYVGKAIFHTASGEALLKIEGSLGWKEALKQKYHSLDAQSRRKVRQSLEVLNGNDHNKKETTKNHTAAKAAVAAAAGGGTVVGGTSLAAAGMGYTATGISAGSYAAAIMSAEAVASGGGVAAGGFTATMQSIGAVGVMASPVGVTLAAIGAVGGLGAYYFFHCHNQQQKKQKEEEDKIQSLEQMEKKLMTSEDEASESVNHWVLVSAQRVALKESKHCFSHDAWEDRVKADQAFLEVASNMAAKALFDPHGVVRRVDCDPADRDGWETALSLHYHFLVEEELLVSCHDKRGDHS